MNKIIGLLVLIGLLGCSNSRIKENFEAIQCDNSVTYGNINICLPVIDGMEECYSVPNVKKLADQFEPEVSTVLGFYINNKTYNQVDKLNEISFDDYFKISAANNLKEFEAGKSQLNQMANMLESNFLKANWSEIKDKIDNQLDFISIGQPVLIESYSPHNEIKTFIMIIKYQGEDFEYVMIMSSNMLIIKERLIYLNYYKIYEGEKSITNLKAKNDYIVLRLMEENYN